MKKTFNAQRFVKFTATAAWAVASFAIAPAVPAQQQTTSPRPPGIQAPQPKPPSVELGVDQTFSKPDLVIKEFEKYGQVTIENGYVNIPVKVKAFNQGDTGSAEKTLVGIRAGNQYVWSTFMYPLGQNMADIKIGVVKVKYTQAMKVSKQVMLTAVADAPIGPAEAPASDTGRVWEKNESNNEKTLVVHLGPNGGIDSGTSRPGVATVDLRVTHFGVSGQARYNGSNIEVPFWARVANDGQASANDKSILGIEFHGKILTHSFVDPLNSKQAATVNGTLKISDPNRMYAGKKIPAIAIADAAIGAAEAPVGDYGRFLESNEQNNRRTMFISVPSQGTYAPNPTGGRPSYQPATPGLNQRVPARPQRVTRPSSRRPAPQTKRPQTKRPQTKRPQTKPSRTRQPQRSTKPTRGRTR